MVQYFLFITSDFLSYEAELLYTYLEINLLISKAVREPNTSLLWCTERAINVNENHKISSIENVYLDEKS